MAESGRGTIGDDSLKNWVFVGSGGFGCVWKATHKRLGKVAIKLLNHDDSSGKLYANLCREADHMKDADQFVPRVYGMYCGRPPVMDNKEMKGIVMELMEGGSLESFLLKKTQSKPPPWPLAFRLAHQVALAMDFLHVEKNLVHMDLKPANILLDADFNAKIADFGLSTVTNSVMSTNHTNKGGTLSYTPPEAFDDKYRRVRSYDVYSYGILLWTILTGKSPYPGVGHTRLRFHIPRGARPDLGKIDVQKAAGLDELVELMQRCWQSDPTKRPLFAECVEVTRGVLSRHEEGISAACDLLNPRPSVPAPPPTPAVPPGSTDREAFLKRSSRLSLDPNTAHRYVLLSQNHRKATHTAEHQRYADNNTRFTHYPQVLSSECISEPTYFEVTWCGERVAIAVCQDDVNRKDSGLSWFGFSPQSWALRYYDSDKRYRFIHNSIPTAVSGPVPATGRSHRVGVYVDPPAGVLCFYDVCGTGNTMSLLHTVRTTFTRPLHAGIGVYYGSTTAEVCEIW